MKFIWPPILARSKSARRRSREGLAAADQGQQDLDEARGSAPKA